MSHGEKELIWLVAIALRLTHYVLLDGYPTDYFSPDLACQLLTVTDVEEVLYIGREYEQQVRAGIDKLNSDLIRDGKAIPFVFDFSDMSDDFHRVFLAILPIFQESSSVRWRAIAFAPNQTLWDRNVTI